MLSKTSYILIFLQEVLPSLKEETHCKLKENEKMLDRLGNNIPKEIRERQHFLTDVSLISTDLQPHSAYMIKRNVIEKYHAHMTSLFYFPNSRAFIFSLAM